MSNQFKETWEKYVSSWKTESFSDKKAIYETCLDTSCEYIDPLTKAPGWAELTEYMQSFHEQIPGAYFETTYFLTHHSRGIVKWEMKDSGGSVLSIGISYVEYSAEGKMTSIIGFYETPQS